MRARAHRRGRPEDGGLLRRGLADEGHAADIAATGDDALWMAQAVAYDAIVLDVMLPGRDGFAVCRQLRRDDVWSPVLLLTARDAVEDRVAGLDSGADDYLPKPFSFSELLARLRALTELLPTAFERFTRGDEARDRGGTGLGLAIVEAVARAHGGRARAEASTVTIELPSE